jgi:uncharacterized membrane protein YccC
MRGVARFALPLDLTGISVIAGLRAATASAVPVVAAELLHQPGITWMGIAAFWACLADNGGSMRTRLSAMSGVTLLGSAACGLAALLAGSGLVWPAVLYAAFVSFCGSYARIFGGTATSVGLLVTVTILVSLGLPPQPVAQIPAFVLLYLAGGLWATLLTLGIWRLYPHQPGRDAIAGCFTSLADLARGIGRLYHSAAPPHEAWGALTLQRRPSREAIEAARGMLADLRRGRGGQSGRGEGLILLLESADQIFLGLIGLSDLLERSSTAAERPALHALVERAVDLIEPSLRAIADVLAGRASQASFTIEAAVARLEAEIATRQDSPLLAHAAELLASLARLAHAAYDIAREVRSGRTLGAMLRQQAEAGNEAALAALAVAPPDRPGLQWDELMTAIRANLTWRSITFRHAVRLAVTAAASVAVTEAFGLERGYWLSVTAVLSLQPYYATTWQRAVERVGGSVLGGLAAAGLALLFTSPLAIALLIFPIAAIASAFRTVNYGLFTFLLTPQFVLIAELAQPGGDDLALAGLRALNSLAGGVLALVAGALLWPTRERRHLPAHLGAALGGAADYLGAVLSVMQGAELPAAAVEASRRKTGLASNNAEASLQRLLSEPGPRPRDAEPAMAIVTSVRRISGAVTALWARHDLAELGRAVPEIAPFAAWAAEALTRLADAIAERAAPPDLPPTPDLGDGGSAAALSVRDALARLARQIMILHSVAGRLAETG